MRTFTIFFCIISLHNPTSWYFNCYIAGPPREGTVELQKPHLKWQQVVVFPFNFLVIGGCTRSTDRCTDVTDGFTLAGTVSALRNLQKTTE